MLACMLDTQQKNPLNLYFTESFYYCKHNYHSSHYRLRLINLQKKTFTGGDLESKSLDDYHEKSIYGESGDIDYSNNGYDLTGRLNTSGDSLNTGTSGTSLMQIQDDAHSYNSYVSILFHNCYLFLFN